MRFVYLTFFLLLFSMPVRAATDTTEGEILVTIKPLHSLVSAVAGPEQNVALLLTGNYSPHDFALRPSQMRQLQSAKVFFYVGEGLESFLLQVLPSLPNDQLRVAVSHSPSVTLLPSRQAGIWPQQHDDHHNSDHHDAIRNIDDHEHDDHEKTDDHNNHDHAAHDHGGIHDPHIWLDPANAALIAADIAENLARAFPENRSRYIANAATLQSKLAALDTTLQARLEPVKGKPFIQFHDSVQYFEARYGLKGLGAINLEPDDSPSARRIGDIQNLIADQNVRCVFREPQYSDRLVRIVIADSGASSATLDPLGVPFSPGPELYFQMMEGIATAMRECLGSTAP